MTAQTLTGRHAFVTGAGTGIGAEVARLLVAAGAHVTLAGRREAPLAALAAVLGDRAVAAPGFDVTREDVVAQGIAAAQAAAGPIDILVNNAGEAESAPIERTSLGLWSTMLAANLTGTFLCTRAVLPGMAVRGSGRVINIASTAGLIGYAYVAAYSAAKHGVIGLTRALAREVAQSGVTVNAVCPGYTETPMFEHAVDSIVGKTGRTPDEARAILTRTNPQGRLVSPAEVADTVLWLASPGARAITGQAIVVAGGEVMSG